MGWCESGFGPDTLKKLLILERILVLAVVRNAFVEASSYLGTP